MKLLQTLTMFVCHNRVPTKTLSLFDLEDNAALCSIVGLTFSHICNAVISEDMEKRLVRKGIGVVLKAPSQAFPCCQLHGPFPNLGTSICMAGAEQ